MPLKSILLFITMEKTNVQRTNASVYRPILEDKVKVTLCRVIPDRSPERVENAGLEGTDCHERRTLNSINESSLCDALLSRNHNLRLREPIDPAQRIGGYDCDVVPETSVETVISDSFQEFVT